VDPAAVALYYTSTTASRFRVEYGPGDSFSSAGTFSSYWINGVTAGGTAIPLVQRSDLADGTFRDTRWHDVFEPGPGSDTIHVNGWGNDAFRFAAGDGQDVIKVDNNYYPELMGNIRLRAGVDPESVSFSFLNGDAVITYGPGDQITLDTDTVFSAWDNTLGRFTLVSEADPAWIPVIRAEGYVGLLHGSYGADHIIGGPNIETILPGSGDDIIEAGGNPDRIVFNDVYMDQGSRGIGRKHIWGQGDNDIIETPLYQGLTFHYNRGDGDDRIEYDWSYSWQHPYRFSYDEPTNSLSFQPYGEDTLAFGGDITLADLRFIRTGATLTVALRDGGGSVTVAEFFHTWDVEATPEGGVPPQIPEEGAEPDSLLDPAFLHLLPRTPIAALSFADGSRYDMAAVLDSFLEVSDATLLGTEGDDELYGTQGDDVIHALGGNDYIEDVGGSNVVLAGAGDDQLLLGSDTTMDPGAGDDWVLMVAGNHVISFGPGAGSDLVMLDVALGTVVVELAAGLTEADIAVTLVAMEWGEVPMITLPGSGDALVLASLRYNPELDTWSADADSVAATLRFADGSVISGTELYVLAAGGGGSTFEGTSGDDVLVGTEGNDVFIGGAGDDIMDGDGGDDLFLVEGRRQGGDRITGGAGFDTIRGGAGDDRITLTELLVSDSVELIDGGPGLNSITGTGGANTLDFSGTELRAIAAIDGRGGSDHIVGSAGDDVLIGGAGRDTLSGGRGNDTYVFRAGEGRDTIENADADPASLDILQLADLDYHQVWLSRRRDHLVLNIAGSTDRVLIRDWYLNEASQLDAIYAGGHVLLRDQVDQLVSAMAAFDVPEGVDAIIPGETALELAPVLSAVWQVAA
jgi:Ca2+-binding RTX toxin-like protein